MNFDSVKISQLPSQLFTLLFITNTVNNAITITGDHQNFTLQQLILPLFLVTFAGPIVGNIIFEYFKFSIESFISFFIALALVSALKRIKKLHVIYKMAPLIGKVLMICDMKNRDSGLHLLAFWVLVSNFVGSIVMKFLMKDELIMSEGEIKDVFGTILCLIMVKHFQLNDLFAGMLTVLFLLFLKKDVILMCKRKMEVCDEELSPELVNSEGKTPRRRGRPRKVESVETGSITPRKASARKIDFDD